ncbi:unnamed protein product [Leuciscus chuanchicus]
MCDSDFVFGSDHLALIAFACSAKKPSQADLSLSAQSSVQVLLQHNSSSNWDGLYGALPHSQKLRPPVGFLCSLMAELWPEGCSQDRRGGKEGGSALFHRDPRPARYRPPESIPCWDIIPFNQGWLPDWSNKGQGGVRAAASREAGPTQTRSHGSENQRQRDRCHRCPPIYTPPPTHPPINKYHTVPFMPRVFAYGSSS